MNKVAVRVAGGEPNALPHEVQCICCPRRVSVLTQTYVDTTSAKSREVMEYCVAPRPKPFTFDPSDYRDFIRGLLLEVTVARGNARLKKYELSSEMTPHGRDAYRMPSFGLVAGKVVWVCPTCEEIFKGHPFNAEQYLAERQLVLGKLGISFKLSNSTTA